MARLALLSLGAALVAPACAHRPAGGGADGPEAARSGHPGVVEARQFIYRDTSGLTVATTAASVDQRASAHTSLYVRAVADYIHLERRQLDPSDPTGADVMTGHRDADVVTSASALPSGGGSTDKWRAEVAGGPTFDGTVRGAPASVGLLARASFEPDYRSYSIVARTAAELAQQNLTLTAFAGFGHDDVVPSVAPAGQAALWPASHDRVTGGATASQILSPRILLSAGAALSRQEGQLASPYRRALVRTTLFPETVPGVRLRGTAFVGASASVAPGTGLHARVGGYADSWSVRAVIPEAAVTKELGPRWLLYGRYRFYAQRPAAFYQPVYPDLLPIMSGDPRAGEVRAHTAGVSAQLDTSSAGAPGGTGVVAAYDASFLSYPLLGQTVIAHVLTVGLNLQY